MDDGSRRAESTLARAWRRANSRSVSAEGFLEDALAAALEHPVVWPGLVRHLGWLVHGLPLAPPLIRTQHAGDFGRTDIELDWPDPAAPTLILELKTSAPPAVDQVSAYLGREGVLLAAVASWSNERELRTALPPGQAARLLGVVTWSQLRRLAEADAPLELRQLQHLIDALGVAMPQVGAEEMAAAAKSLPVWAAWDSWMTSGLAAARPVLAGSGLATSSAKRPRHDGGWYAGWLELPFPNGERGTLWAGVILDHPDYPPIQNGMPDLVLQLEIDTDSDVGHIVHDDPLLATQLRAWSEDAAVGEVRICPLEDDEWTVLGIRCSSASLLTLPDQSQGFTDWVQGAVEKWSRCDILERLAELTRQAVDSPQRA